MWEELKADIEFEIFRRPAWERFAIVTDLAWVGKAVHLLRPGPKAKQLVRPTSRSTGMRPKRQRTGARPRGVVPWTAWNRT